MFFVQYECFWFQYKQLKNTHTHFGQGGGVATKRFSFINPCLAKCEKLSFFWGPFSGQILVDVQKIL